MLNRIITAAVWGLMVLICLLMFACATHHDNSIPSEGVSELIRLNGLYDLCENEETLVYDIVTVDETGVVLPYGTMELHTQKEDDTLWMKDTIALNAEYTGMIFARTLSYKQDDLLHPLSVTLDITAASETRREMSYSEGLFSVYGKEPVEADFSEGILTYNAMLRVVRMLDTTVPHRYTFSMYAEPFLFRVQMPDEDEVLCLEVYPERTSNPYASGMNSRVFMRIRKHQTEIFLDDKRRPITMIEYFSETKKAVFKLRS